MSNPTLFFTPIKTLPSVLYPYWISSDPGYPGCNPCLVLDSSTGSVIPNCTGWAYGAFAYHSGILNNQLPGDLNAVNWYADTRITYQRGTNPKLGAVICFADGPTSTNTAGHVAVVEEIASDGSYIWTSESNFNHFNYPFRYMKRYLSDGWNVRNSDYPNIPSTERYYEDMIFQGFIYAPVEYITGNGIIPLGRRRKNVQRTILL